MSLILKILISSISILIASRILPGVNVDSFQTSVIVAIVLGVINMFIKPILTILTLPINIVTLGLFSLFINGLLILLTSTFIKGFYVENILWAIIFSIVITIITSLLNRFLK